VEFLRESLIRQRRNETFDYQQETSKIRFSKDNDSDHDLDVLSSPSSSSDSGFLQVEEFPAASGSLMERVSESDVCPSSYPPKRPLQPVIPPTT
jgi:hypothetical protein